MWINAEVGACASETETENGRIAAEEESAAAAPTSTITQAHNKPYQTLCQI